MYAGGPQEIVSLAWQTGQAMSAGCSVSVIRHPAENLKLKHKPIVENLESHQIQRARDSAKLVRVVAIKPALDAQARRMAPARQAATGHHLHMRAIENSRRLLWPVFVKQEVVDHQPVAHI